MDSLPTQPPPPPPPAISDGARLALMLALIVFFLAVVLSMAALFGSLLFVAGTFVAARPLELLGALDEDWARTLAGALMAAMAFALAAGWRGLRKAATLLFDAPVYRPAWGITGITKLFLGYLAFQLLVFVPLDRLELYDIDDGKLGAAMVALVVFAALSLAWLIIRKSWALCLWLWRASSVRPLLAGFTLATTSIASGAVLTARALIEPSSEQVRLLNELEARPIEASRHVMQQFASTKRGKSSAKASAVGGGGVFGGRDGPFDDCFEELQGAACDRVWQRALQANRDESDQEDHVQEAFIYTCIHKGLRAPRSCAVFSAKVQRRRVDFWRRERIRQAYREGFVVPCPTPTPLDEAMSEEERALLVNAVEQLDTRSQTILNLRYGKDWKDHEIAARLGLSPVTVGVLRRKAENEVKEKMESCR